MKPLQEFEPACTDVKLTYQQARSKITDKIIMNLVLPTVTANPTCSPEDLNAA